MRPGCLHHLGGPASVSRTLLVLNTACVACTKELASRTSYVSMAPSVVTAMLGWLKRRLFQASRNAATVSSPSGFSDLKQSRAVMNKCHSSFLIANPEAPVSQRRFSVSPSKRSIVLRPSLTLFQDIGNEMILDMTDVSNKHCYKHLKQGKYRLEIGS